jgi:hypothetical protein
MGQAKTLKKNHNNKGADQTPDMLRFLFVPGPAVDLIGDIFVKYVLQMLPDQDVERDLTALIVKLLLLPCVSS